MECGAIINHDTIFNNTKIHSNFIAETDVSVLKFERDIFEEILREFPDFKKDV